MVIRIGILSRCQVIDKITGCVSYYQYVIPELIYLFHHHDIQCIMIHCTLRQWYCTDLSCIEYHDISMCRHLLYKHKYVLCTTYYVYDMTDGIFCILRLPVYSCEQFRKLLFEKVPFICKIS